MGTAATNTTITLSDSLFTTASDLRVASLSLAAYECVASCVSPSTHRNSYSASYLLTLPMEYRLYRSSGRRM